MRQRLVQDQRKLNIVPIQYVLAIGDLQPGLAVPAVLRLGRHERRDVVLGRRHSVDVRVLGPPYRPYRSDRLQVHEIGVRLLAIVVICGGRCRRRRRGLVLVGAAIAGCRSVGPETFGSLGRQRGRLDHGHGLVAGTLSQSPELAVALDGRFLCALCGVRLVGQTAQIVGLCTDFVVIVNGLRGGDVARHV